MIKDLLLIILGATVCCAYYSWEDYKRKKEIKKQERLNEIRTNRKFRGPNKYTI